MKFLDSIFNVAPVLGPGSTVADSINEIVQGTGESERIGRKVTLKGIYWRGLVSLVPNPVVAPAQAKDVYRFILYLDKQANGQLAAPADIYNATNLGFQSFRELANTQRFRILVDQTRSITAAAGATGVGPYITPEHNIIGGKRCNIPIEFSGNTGAIAEIRSNNIGILMFSAGGVNLDVSFNIRIRYSDK